MAAADAWVASSRRGGPRRPSPCRSHCRPSMTSTGNDRALLQLTQANFT